MKKSIFFFLCLTSSLFAQDEWESFKNETVLKMTSIDGWCSKEKALLMMDVIRENRCQHCIEIGVFSGKSLFPIAKTLQYIGSGKVAAIDAWDPLEAIKGLSPSDPGYTWWGNLDLNQFYRKTLLIINENELNQYCEIVKQPSQIAASLFFDETIDFIHIDGNHNEEFVFQDVTNYFPKVKDGGYIILNDSNSYNMYRAIVFLLERADLVSSFSPSAAYLLFRKNKQRTLGANLLMNE